MACGQFPLMARLQAVVVVFEL